MLSFIRVIALISLIVWQPSAWAVLNLELTQGVSNLLPIAIVPFTGQSDANTADNVASVVMNDLRTSGQFKVIDTQNMPEQPHSANEVKADYWRSADTDSVVVGNIQAVGSGRCQVSFALINVVKNNQILASQTFTVANSELRRLGHHISDLIYEQLTGVPGVFSTRIAYVLVQHEGNGKSRYSLQISDMDGYNSKPLLTSDQPIMSPAWSHDGTRLAYVSFETVTPKIYVQQVASGARHMVSGATGINGAPAWSPDDSQLALVLSKSGSPKIYTMGLASGQTRQLSNGTSIDTEPSWSPDGKSLLFTSDRGGSPQIYQLSLSNNEVHRLTFTGGYNARASFSADGKKMVMINREQGMYNIAVQDLSNGTVQVLTQSGYDASPSFAPNARMVLYESNPGQQGTLGIVSIDGRTKLRLPAPNGSVQDPAWSPFLR